MVSGSGYFFLVLTHGLVECWLSHPCWVGEQWSYISNLSFTHDSCLFNLIPLSSYDSWAIMHFFLDVHICDLKLGIICSHNLKNLICTYIYIFFFFSVLISHNSFWSNMIKYDLVLLILFTNFNFLSYPLLLLCQIFPSFTVF
jgi:hypothetical protein